MGEASEEILELQVQNDYVLAQSRVSMPAALAELVWNALDAEATIVDVTFARLDSEFDRDRVVRITISDNGTGISHEVALAAFGQLGGSWKRIWKRPPKARAMHGRHGRGRLVVFALGSQVQWQTTYRYADGLRTYNIRSSSLTPRRYYISAPTPAPPDAQTGTEVIIERDENKSPAAFTEAMVESWVKELTHRLALYMSKYRNVAITVDGRPIEYAKAIEWTQTYDLGEFEYQFNLIPVRLVVVEWRTKTIPREMYLCDTDSFPLIDIRAGIHAPGFCFTAYIESDLFKNLGRQRRAGPSRVECYSWRHNR